MADKLFVIVRADLPPGDQACQAVHAAVLFAHLHPEAEGAWFESSKNVALLAVPDEAALFALVHRAGEEGVPYAANTEPDLGDSLTSVALAPGGKRFTRRLPLLLATKEKAPDPDGSPALAWAV